MRQYADRKEAGDLLAESLRKYANEDTLVLAIPRGGIIVGYEVARKLGLPLDVVILKKLGAPMNPELAIGAITSQGALYLDQEVTRMTGADDQYVQEEIKRKLIEIREQEKLYENVRPGISPEGMNLIVVDDGSATGSTIIAAVKALRSMHPKQIIAAVPVASQEAVARIDRAADIVVVLQAPQDFYAVGQFYRTFQQTEHEEVIELLDKARSSVSYGS